MAETRNSCRSNSCSSLSRDSVCIDANRILDSCRDKDCFENIRVFLTDFGQEIIEKTNSVRIKCTKVIWTSLVVEPVQFNRGFFRIYVRFYVKIVAEACVCMGKAQEIEGIAVCEKTVILYGSEGNVSIFKSGKDINFCTPPPCDTEIATNMPVAVCEEADSQKSIIVCEAYKALLD